MTQMSKHNGMSDTQKIPIPKDPVPQENRQPKRPPSGSNPMSGARQRSVQQSLRRSEMRNGTRDSGVRQQRQASMNQQRSTGMQTPDPFDEQIYYQQGRPAQRPHMPAGIPPQAGLQRASWEGNYSEGSMMPPPPQNTYVQPPEFQDDEPAPKHRRKRRKRRHSCLRRIIWSVLSFVFVIFAIYSIISISAIRKIQHIETGERHLTAAAPEPDSKIRNILLIGTDARGDEQGRADTMILLSFSKYNSTLTITSILRDSYVNIPGHGVNKLNAAYAFGGPTLLMDTISNNFGIRIDEFICVNFKAFVHIADAVGGFKIQVSDREAQAINVILESEVNRIMGDDPKADFLPSGGTFVLNGKQALSYARIRYVGNADFERTERQRTVLNLLLDKLKLLRPSTAIKILKNAMPDLSTNISGGSLYWLSLKLPYQLIAYDKQSMRLPADGTYTDQTAPDGQMVLAVDFNANAALYQQAVRQKGGLDTITQTGSTDDGTQTGDFSTLETPSDRNGYAAPADSAAIIANHGTAVRREAQPQNAEELPRPAA